jgi:hypothetical protein
MTNLVPGSSLCFSSAQDGSELYRHGTAYPGPGHWRKHGDLQLGRTFRMASEKDRKLQIVGTPMTKSHFLALR